MSELLLLLFKEPILIELRTLRLILLGMFDIASISSTRNTVFILVVLSRLQIVVYFGLKYTRELKRPCSGIKQEKNTVHGVAKILRYPKQEMSMHFPNVCPLTVIPIWKGHFRVVTIAEKSYSHSIYTHWNHYDKPSGYIQNRLLCHFNTFRSIALFSRLALTIKLIHPPFSSIYRLEACE